ncbi:lysine biosynthesis protein LysW [Streptomyces lavendulae]|uniref:lysine biosynthesis protein LysW n=1 Tax=Streptomyces lavendulae TaxID=1914 RepID=UPI0033C56976
MIACPECEASVIVGDVPLVSEIVECGDCSTELEILSVDPLQVALAPEIEEDWGE